MVGGNAGQSDVTYMNSLQNLILVVEPPIRHHSCLYAYHGLRQAESA